jgi:mannose-6-phosphate isomerase-like protein (cupin superfamily)
MKDLRPLLAILVLAAATAITRSQIAAKRSAEQSADAKASVTLIPGAKVEAAFAKGTPLFENSEFKVHASRRDAPGIAELHGRDTDIFHVLEGSATFVIGGTTVEPKTVAPDEIRGKAIQGGENRRISKGDVIIIPKGVPHWFKEVDGPLLYYVVKVTSPR